MCEIAVLDPSRTSIEIAQQLAYTFHDEQGDGVGILMVQDTGDKYEYESYKSTTPHWQTLYSFLNREWDDTWRVIVHGRYGTSGGVSRGAAHPIEVDCDHDGCDFDYVIHNGSVRNWRQQRASLISHGHTFTGSVDTEVIPHKVGTLPDGVDDLSYNTYNISGNLNYLLFSEDGIFVRTTRKYDLTDDFRMTCRLSSVSDHGFESGNVRWLVSRPGEDIETKESRTRTHSNNNTKYNYRYSRGTNGASDVNESKWGNRQTRGTESDEETSGVTVNYTDLINTYDYLSAIKLAPGLLKITDDQEGNETYIHRSKSPRLYYFYAPESIPEDVTMEELEEASSGFTDPVKEKLIEAGEEVWEQMDDDDTEQQSLDDVDEPAEEEAAAEAKRATASVVAEAAPENEDINAGPNVEFGDGIKQLFDGMDA